MFKGQNKAVLSNTTKQDKQQLVKAQVRDVNDKAQKKDSTK